MYKPDIAAQAGGTLGIAPDEVVAMMDRFIAATIKLVAAGQIIEIENLGTFDTFIDPARGDIPARRMPRFTAATTILQTDLPAVFSTQSKGLFEASDTAALEECFNISRRAIASGDRATWQGFGTFDSYELAPIEVIDPDTDEKHSKAGGRSGRFNCGADIKKAVDLAGV